MYRSRASTKLQAWLTTLGILFPLLWLRPKRRNDGTLLPRALGVLNGYRDPASPAGVRHLIDAFLSPTDAQGYRPRFGS